MSKEEILSRTVQADSCNDRATTWEEDYAGGTCEYIRSDLVFKAMTEYAHRAIEEAAEVAETDVDYSEERIRHIVDKQSILKLKEKY